MSRLLRIVVNGEDRFVADDFGSSPEQLLRAIEIDPKGVYLYREDDPVIVPERDECTTPMIVEEGDQFIVVEQGISSDPIFSNPPSR